MLTIGQVAARTGLAVSAIRFYESEGLVFPERNAGGQRRFHRSDIRRLSFVLVAQKLGFGLADIKRRMATLPQSRTPTVKDWARMSKDMRAELDQRIKGLEQLRDRLDGCIGCGCLSLPKCAIFNTGDELADQGPGPRKLIG